MHNTENDFFSRSLGPLAPVSAFSEQNEIGHKRIREGRWGIRLCEFNLKLLIYVSVHSAKEPKFCVKRFQT